MEEYEYHSSAEHSPLGYQVKNGHMKTGKEKPKNQTANGNKSNRATNNQRHSPGCPCDRCGQLRMAPAFTQRQAGQWSETNIQSELGYMP